MSSEKETRPVIIKIPQGEEKKAENLKVYLVDKQGAVIESHSLRGGEAQLKTSAENMEGKTTVYIAPDLPEELRHITVTETTLQSMGAWQPSFRLPASNIFQIPYFPILHWPLPFGWCNVQGTVSKTFNVNGVPTVLPICDARVHICEVRIIRFIINRIPNKILQELRDRLATVIKFPIPIPDPGPIERVNIRQAFQQNSAQFETRELQASLPERPELPLNVQKGIINGTLETFRATLANNFDLFHPYLCWWPWFWPWFYICDEVATVTTDCNGRFDYNLFYFLKNHPNVYIWVEVLIGGSWVTVYKPWISCNTHWNYACGTDINITVTSPGLLPCSCGGSTIEDNHVLIENVNNGVSIRSIQQSETASGHLSNAVGLTAYSDKGNISPFATSFLFVVQFGDGLNTFGVTHYRWSYTMKKDAYLTTPMVADTKHIIGGNISKPCHKWVEISPGDFERLTNSFVLGPFLDTSNRVMYKIPHTDAAVDVGAGFIWDTADDTSSVNIISGNWNPGLYEFTIELLDDNGNTVPLAANPFKVNRLAGDPGPVTPGIDTINADGLPENYLIKDGSGKIIGFKFLMRIDNNSCYAGIADAKVAGATTDTECGTGYYNDKNTDTVDLYFEAGHPHNFAIYSFDVYKGNSGTLSVAASSGTSANANNVTSVTAVASGDNSYDIKLVDIAAPLPPLPPNPSNPVSNMDQYHKSIPVSIMLGNCTMAAFSENLSVTATQTDGSTTLLGFDAGHVAAIAIAPNS